MPSAPLSSKHPYVKIEHMFGRRTYTGQCRFRQRAGQKGKRAGSFTTMMSQEQNDLLTRTGPRDPAGKLMRLYWQPAALVEELDPRRPIVPVKLLGEDFVLFRDPERRYGLLDRDCPHRGADLAFGRLEGGGLRCAFHGWLFDASGQCLDMPAEPEDSTFCARIRQRAFPTIERNGILFAYLGGGDPP